MDSALTITISGEQELQQRLAALPTALSNTLTQQSGILAQQIVQMIVDEKLSGEVLQSHTGKLKSSVESSVDASDGNVTGAISVDGVTYAAIQEYGGTTKAHIIEATNAKALAFAFQGKQAFFERIQHPGSNIPERSFMRSSLEESADMILVGFKHALADAVGN